MKTMPMHLAAAAPPGASGARVCDSQHLACKTDPGLYFRAAMHSHMLRLTEPRSGASSQRAFTLIELLVVISIIAVLAALTLGVVKSVTKTKYKNNAQAEMASIISAIESYHAAYGVYPPSGPGYSLTNSLLFELEGTTNSAPPPHDVPTFTTLDGHYSILAADLQSQCGVSGIVNCSRGKGEDLVMAKVFLPSLKLTQVATNSFGAFLATSVGGPDLNYRPFGNLPGMNPWRYNSANPTNNPNSYDLYVQLVINGQSNLICNWSKQVQINNLSYP